MAEPMTDARLDEISALADAATPGPWWYLPNGRVLAADLTHPRPGDISYTVMGAFEECDDHACDRDGEFAADARTAVPELIAEVRRLRAVRPVSDLRLDRLAAIAATPTAIGQQPELCEGVQQLVAKVRQLREMYHSACDRADNLGAQLQGCWDKNNQLGEENARLRAQLAAKEA